jgi:ferredoxin
MHSEHHDDTPGETVMINWVRRDGSKKATPAKVGSNLLRTAQRYELEIEGACEGVCACSTCHCILEPSVYDSLPEPTEKEEDMLDQAFGLTPTSRLGCQVVITNDMNGIIVKLPKATRNFYVVSLGFHACYLLP